jgi:hypothetical protein
VALLFDEDYVILKETGLAYEEDEANRFLILKNYPLAKGLYVAGGNAADAVNVLSIIPPNYNTQGCDMFWVYPQLSRADGKAIPNIGGPAHDQDPRTYKAIVYCRWSRHWNKIPWRAKQDNVQTILNRIEWALRNPDADRA